MAIPKQYKSLIQKSANQWGIKPSLLAALLMQESGFNPNARSPVGALGIGQFMPATAKQYGINPLDPMQAIPASAKYLGKNYKTYGGNVDKTLASYNAGPGAVAKYGGVPPFKETQNYVKRIKQLEAQFAKEFLQPTKTAKKPSQPSISPLFNRDLPFIPVFGAAPDVPAPARPMVASAPILESPQNTIAIGDPQMPIPFAAMAATAASKAAPSMAASAAPAASGVFSRLMGGLGNVNQLLGGLNQMQGLIGGGQGMPMPQPMPMNAPMPDIRLNPRQFMPIQFAMNPDLRMLNRGMG